MQYDDLFPFPGETPADRSRRDRAKAMEELFSLLYKAAEQLVRTETRPGTPRPIPHSVAEKAAFDNVEEVIAYYLTHHAGTFLYRTAAEKEAVRAELLRMYYAFAKKDMYRDAATYYRRDGGSLDAWDAGTDSPSDLHADDRTQPRPGVPLPLLDPDDDLGGVFGRQVWQTLCTIHSPEWAAALWGRLRFDLDWKEVAEGDDRKPDAVRKQGRRDIERLARELVKRGYLPDGIEWPDEPDCENRRKKKSPDANESASGDAIFGLFRVYRHNLISLRLRPSHFPVAIA